MRVGRYIIVVVLSSPVINSLHHHYYHNLNDLFQPFVRLQYKLVIKVIHLAALSFSLFLAQANKKPLFDDSQRVFTAYENATVGKYRVSGLILIPFIIQISYTVRILIF